MLDLLFDPDEISPWSLLWPSCLLCGAVIRPAHCSVSSTAYQRTVGRQLHQKNDQEHKQVVISAKKVEEEYLSDCPSLGASTFRASESPTKTIPLILDISILTLFYQ
jgi:hypothetical protein